MANTGFNDVQSRAKGIKIIYARLRILGNTTPANGTFSVVEGQGVASLTRTNTGEYTVTLRDPYMSLVGAHFSVLAATPIDLVPQMETEAVATAKTIVFNMMAGATPTDTANGVTQDVFMTLALRNTSALR